MWNRAQSIYWMFGARCGCKMPLFANLFLPTFFCKARLEKPNWKVLVANLPLDTVCNFVMSCFSRLLGLICAVLPGLLFLAFSVLFFQRWTQLGLVTGPLYSVASLITGAVCLYLGIGILFGRDHAEEPETIANSVPQAVAPVVAPVIEQKPLQAAPLPIIEAAAESVRPEATTQSIFASTDEAPAPVAVPLDSPETRIRQLAQKRPNWQVTAPQLAQLTNLNMAVADATAREMVESGHAQMQTGPSGETIYIFDLTNEAG